MEIDECADVALALSAFGIHELFGLLVAKLDIVATAAPLPLHPLCVGDARGPGWGGAAAGRLTATLQQLPHAAGLRDRMRDPRRCDGVHKRRLTDICHDTHKHTQLDTHSYTQPGLRLL